MATRLDLLLARKDMLLEAQAKLEALQNNIADPVSEQARRVQAQLDTVASQIAETDDEIDQILGSDAPAQPASDQQIAKIKAATEALRLINVDGAKAREVFNQVVSAMEQAGGG